VIDHTALDAMASVRVWSARLTRLAHSAVFKTCHFHRTCDLRHEVRIPQFRHPHGLEKFEYIAESRQAMRRELGLPATRTREQAITEEVGRPP
jgi:hypothetical protein